MCTLDWPPWASTCPSPTYRRLWGIAWLLSSRPPPPVIQALSCLRSRRSWWYTLGIPVGPMKEDVERARMTSPSLTTDNMNSVFSAIRHCWPSSTRRECSSVPLKTSNWCSGFCWKSKARLRQRFPVVFSSKSKRDSKKIAPSGTFCNLRGAIGSEKRHSTALIFLFFGHWCCWLLFYKTHMPFHCTIKFYYWHWGLHSLQSGGFLLSVVCLGNTILRFHLKMGRFLSV